MDSAGDFRNAVLLAGGVGGARMAEGLARALPSGALTVIANIGDDEEFYGLRVCPDLDTLLYTLSDRIDRSQGWGVAGDTVKALDVLRDLGAPAWMKLGDADFGLHIWRSWRLAEGESLSEITAEAARRLGARASILPATDERLRTKLNTDEGWMDFQPWFVGKRCGPKVSELRYEGAEMARPSERALKALASAQLIVLAPSNPLLSIEPMLAVAGLRGAVAQSRAPCVGVSPLIGGKAVKGPLARLMQDLGLEATSRAVAGRYAGLLDGFVVDAGDVDDAEALRESGLAVASMDILMDGPEGAERLAREVLDFAAGLAPGRERRSA
ncbi:2-phospho-L-lactate transferase [Mesorhizobium sp. VNQ89]|uniref:2-phospho-L-lactate transferase n=1 Tax=Mesorhizobium quangtriensis TaxID=3157709 RepID=UPI0032B73553